jgi:chromosome partitioning protein
MRTIAVVNRKGGSGKTTTAVSLAAALAERGSPVLLVDLDPQASASGWLAGSPADRAEPAAFIATHDLGSLRVDTSVPNLQLIRSSGDLLTAERTLQADLSLKVMRAIGGLPHRWGFVILDCPPSLSYLSVGALMAAGEVVIPVEAHSIALPGVAAIVHEMQRVQSTLNPGLREPLIVACRVNRTLHARWVIDELRRRYGWRVAQTAIRESVRLAEAEAARLPITAFAPESGAAEDYRRLAEELIEREAGVEPNHVRISRWRRWFARPGHIAASIRRAG